MSRRLPRPFLAAGLVLVLLVAGGAAAYNADDIALAGKRNLVVAAADAYPAGSNATFSVGVEAISGAPVADTLVVVKVNGARAFEARTDAEGLVRATVTFPEAPGTVDVVVEAAGESVTRSVSLTDGRRVLVTTDKPLYQPGQTLHARALVFDGSPPRAAALPVTFRILDADGNLVLKEDVTADRHGVATVDYALSDQLPLGTFRIEAVSGAKRADVAVRVDEYVLPQFELRVDGLRSWYLPGDTVQGTLDARYSFGKPVSGTAAVALRVYEGVWRETWSNGTLDENGRYRFSFPTPEHAAGLRGNDGNALIEVKYVVTDDAGHAENASRVVPLARDPLEVRAIADENVPGTDSTWTFVVTRPDGSPVANANVTVGFDDAANVRAWHATTDARGIARVTFPFTDQHHLTARITAGEHVIEREWPVQETRGLKIVSETPRVTVGENAAFTIHYSGDALTRTVYYEVQAKDVTLDVGRAMLDENGRATVSVPVTPDHAPLVTLAAYKIERDFSTVRARAVAGVDAPSDLKVDVTPAPQTVEPGEDVNVTFNVTDADGAPVPGAVLGVTGVDRSVGEAAGRYMAALEQAALGVEKELQTPRYQIHAYVYGNSSVVPVLTEPLVQEGDLGAGGGDLRVDETGQEYHVQAMLVKERAVLGYWLTILLGLGALVLWSLAYAGGRLFHAPRAFAVGASVLMITMGGATWLVLDEDDMRTKSWAQRNRGFDAAGGMDGADVVAVDLAADGPAPVMAMDDAVFVRQEAAKGAEAYTVYNSAGDADDARGMQAYSSDASFDRAGAESALAEARRFFPETWAWEPALVVDENGHATLRLVAPDRITTWDVTAFAHTGDARFGTGRANVTVFKSFFAEPDVPVSAVRGDEFPLRVTVFNYESAEKTVEVHLFEDDWFTPLSPLAQRVTVPAHGVARADFVVRPEHVGEWNVTIASGDGGKWDSIVKPFRVDPDGKAFPHYAAGELRDAASATHAVALSPDRIPGSVDAWARIQGGRTALMVDGAEDFIRMVTGCGEQSLSLLSTNVLAYRNLKEARGDDLPAEKEMKFETLITQGLAHEMQYVVKDDKPGRGIVWFPSDTEAHAWLTAWGLVTFEDARRAGFTVDDAVIRDLGTWLRAAQEQDGRWTMTQGEFNNPQLAAKDAAATAYIARALLRSGTPATDPAVAKAMDYVKAHVDDHPDDAYVAALALSMLVEAGDRGALAQRLGDRLESLKVVENGTAHWENDQTPVARKAGDRWGGGHGPFTVEATGYAVMALDGLGGHARTVDMGVQYLLQERRGGTWFGTQDTAVALTALNEVGDDTPVDAVVIVRVDGENVWQGRITDANREVTRLVDLRPFLDGNHSVTLESTGTGRVRYTLFHEEYRPWANVEPDAPPELLLDVEYDSTHVRVGGALAANLRVQYQGEAEAARMVLVQVVAPVGFAFRAAEWDALVRDGTISHYELAGREVNVYLDELPRGQAFDVPYHLDAELPVKATIQGVQAFDMYDPLVRAEAPPVEVVSE